MTFPSQNMTRYQAFLADTDWADATLTPLAQDASARHYLRCQRTDGTTCLLMDASDLPDSLSPFQDVGTWLRRISFTCPESSFYIPDICHQNPDFPFLLIEDLGTASFHHCLQSHPDKQLDFYRFAVQAILDLQHHALSVGPPPTCLPDYSAARLLEEVSRFDRFYLPFHHRTADIGQTSSQAQEIWQDLLSPLLTQENVLVHLDFHMENLFCPPPQYQRPIALIDFQDARWGHPLYDIMSLLWDARRDVSDEIRQTCLTHFIDKNHLLSINRADIPHHLSILIVQRSLKILGIFARQAHFNQNPAYLIHMPRLWKIIQAQLDLPHFHSLKLWLDRVTPDPLGQGHF